MTKSDTGPSRSRLALVIGISLLVLGLTVLTGLGMIWYWWWGPGYFAEANEIRRLAEEIPEVTVLEVDGNHDVGLEDIWLDIEYRGVRLWFADVSSASFREVDHLFVGQVGDWGFSVYGSERGQEPPPEESLSDRSSGPRCYSFGGCLDFGPKGTEAGTFRQ